MAPEPAFLPLWERTWIPDDIVEMLSQPIHNLPSLALPCLTLAGLRDNMTLSYYRSQFEAAFMFFAGESILADARRKHLRTGKSRKERQVISIVGQLPFVLTQENKMSFSRHFKSPQVLPFKRDYEVNPILELLLLLAICNIRLMRN